MALTVFARNHPEERTTSWLENVVYVKRNGILSSGVISDFIALRKPLFLCASCESRMPRRWCTRVDYRSLEGMHGVGRCDGCQQHAPANLYLPEDRPYMAEHRRNTAITQAAIAQRRDHPPS